MRVLAKILLVLVVCIAVFGCGKKSGVEGKLVDGKGQPMGNVKMIAKQVQPIKGYEQFEASTGSDGTFKFKGLYPTSTYKIYPWLGDGPMECYAVDIESGPEGQTSMLKAPLKARHVIKDGIITDSKTGLQWVRDKNKAMLWDEAANYAKNLSVGGGGWRLPSIVELKGIYDPEPAFNIYGDTVWSGQLKDNSSAWALNCSNAELWDTRNPRTHLGFLAVRSPK